MLTLDINKDGHISYEDYEIMGKKVSENSQMTEEQTEATKWEFAKFSERLNLKPGEKIPWRKLPKKSPK